MKFMEGFFGNNEEKGRRNDGGNHMAVPPAAPDDDSSEGTGARIRALQAKLLEFQNNPNHPDIDLRAELGKELENLMETQAKGL